MTQARRDEMAESRDELTEPRDEVVGGEIDWMLAMPADVAQQLAAAVRATVEDRTPTVQLQAMYRALGWRLVAWYLTRILVTTGQPSDSPSVFRRGVLPEGDQARRERYVRSRVVVGRTDSGVVVEAGSWGRTFHDWKQAAQFVGGVLDLAGLGATVDSESGQTQADRQLDE